VLATEGKVPFYFNTVQENEKLFKNLCKKQVKPLLKTKGKEI
jgi:hypothetical protein